MLEPASKVMKLCGKPLILHTLHSKQKSKAQFEISRKVCLFTERFDGVYMECAVRIFMERASAKALKTLIVKSYLGLKNLDN